MSDYPVPRRLSIVLVVLSVVTVAAWVLCFYLGMFLLAMAGGGESITHTPQEGFNFRHIFLLVLMIPVIGLILGWFGAAASKSGVLITGIVILSGWLMLLMGEFTYERIVLNGPTAPGNWSDRDFKISESDRKTYRMLRYGKVLSLRLPSPKILFPDAQSDMLVPTSAQVEVGSVPVRSATPKDGGVCDSHLHEMRFETKAAQPGESDLGGNFFGTEPDFAHYYVSADKHWFVNCVAAPSGRCATLFVNSRLLSEFIVEGKDLCRSPEMNRRLLALVGKWVR